MEGNLPWEGRPEDDDLAESGGPVELWLACLEVMSASVNASGREVDSISDTDVDKLKLKSVRPSRTMGKRKNLMVKKIYILKNIIILVF